GVSDLATDHGGAVHAADDADVVARGHSPIAANNSGEGKCLSRGLLRTYVCTEGIVALEVVHGHVMQMDVLARGDVTRRKTDDLVVAPHWRTVFDGVHRHLVAGWNGIGCNKLFARYGRTRLDVARCNQHIVVRVQPYDHMCGIRSAYGRSRHHGFLHHIVSC